MIIAYNGGETGCICIVDLKSGTAKKIISENKELRYFKPEYSPDGKKVTFVGYFNKKLNDCAVFTANADGSNLKQLTKGGETINQTVFSRYDTSLIFYIKANTFENYSPFASRQPHNMDIYSVNANNQEVNKVTDMKAYGIYSLSETDSAHFLMHLPKGNNGGLFLYEKSSGQSERIVPVYDSRRPVFAYTDPQYNRQYNLLACTGSYQIYIMNMVDKEAKCIYHSNPNTIGPVKFFNTVERLIFSVDTRGLYTINFDGSDLKKLDIVLEE